MKCCPECFGDRGLKRSIIPSRATEVGRCSYCDSENVPILAPTELAEYFELLIGAYQQATDGVPLARAFRSHWGMFGHPRMDEARANDLLVDILGNREIVGQIFVPATTGEANRLVEWEKLRDELMYRNRFFPSVNIDLDRVRFLLDFLKLDPGEVPNVWYRARIKTGEAAFQVSEMGAPPNRIASHGRANPAGIPYLYLGSAERTAVSEIRPHTGEVACVAKFETPADIDLVDLRWPRKMVSPFLLEDAEAIGMMLSDLPFLERLGDELTRPVVPQAAAIDYTPSQYLCEFIKKCGYHGVIYRSSVSDGMNLALFDPTRARSGALSEFLVTKVSVETDPAS